MVEWLTTDGLRILSIIAVVLVANVILRRVSRPFAHAMTRLRVTSHPESAAQRVDTIARILYLTAWILVLIIAALTVLPILGLEIGPLLAAAGVGGIAIAFGAQRLVRDVLNGIFVLVEDQYAIGDFVHLADKEGIVEDISLRRTVIRDFNGVVHHIPHGEITTVSNLGLGYSRVNIDVPLAYRADLDKAIAVIDRVGEELAADPNFAERLISAPKFLRVEEFRDNAVVLKVVGDTKRLEQWAAGGELRRRLLRAFVEEGIPLAGQPEPAAAESAPPQKLDTEL